MADLFVRESGRPNLRAVVFLHGVGNTGGMWQRHMAALPEYRCLAPDLPGHGRSRAQAWASRAETADRIARLIETLPEGRASVIGLSLGGSVAYELLARRPELLDHVIIDGCGAVATRLASVMKIAVAAASPIIRLPAFGRLVARALGISDPPAIADFVEQLGQVDPRSFRRAFSHAQDVRITDALLRATCPTLSSPARRRPPTFAAPTVSSPNSCPTPRAG